MLLRVDVPGDIRVYMDARAHAYVGVTSAIGYLKDFLGDRPDYYGPFAKLHAQEGTWCHEACLDWLAKEKGWISHYEIPVWNPDVHPDEARMRNVIHNAQQAFQTFCEQYEVEALGIETEGHSLACHLAGHVDLVCRLKWKRHRVKAVVDLKFTDSIQPKHELQVRCYNRLDGMTDAQIGLLWHQDRSTGEWVVHPVDLRKDLDDVRAVANAAWVVIWGLRKKGLLVPTAIEPVEGCSLPTGSGHPYSST